jgi:hypothetical protein
MPFCHVVRADHIKQTVKIPIASSAPGRPQLNAILPCAKIEARRKVLKFMARQTRMNKSCFAPPGRVAICGIPPISDTLHLE